MPVTTPVSSTSTVVLSAAAPRVATCGPSIAGLVFQVMPSAQLSFVMRLNIPPLVESFVTYRRSFAELTTAPAGRPLTVKRRNVCLAVVLPPTLKALLDAL